MIEESSKDLIKAVKLYPGFLQYIKEDDELIKTKNQKNFIEFIKTIK